MCDCGEEKIVRSALLVNGKTKSCGCLKKYVPIEDLTGKRFNNLTILSYHDKDKHGKSKWLCLCDCGEKKVLSGADVKQGKIKSCGCLKQTYPTNLTGLKFGRLVVIEKSSNKHKKGSVWLCRCECGKEIEILRDYLTSGNQKSCGCLRGALKFIDMSGEVYGRLLVDGYIGRDAWGKVVWRCICRCGNIVHLKRSDITSGKVTSCGCYKREQTSIRMKLMDRPRGENNPRWNPELTDEERQINRAYHEYGRWRFLIYERDKFKCYICDGGEGSLNAHHIFSYNKYKSLRISIPNGITLCEICHMNFHSKYKRGNNNLKQFAEYLEEIFGLKLDDSIVNLIDKCSNEVENCNISTSQKEVNEDYPEIFNIISLIKKRSKKEVSDGNILCRQEISRALTNS